MAFLSLSLPRRQMARSPLFSLDALMALFRQRQALARLDDAALADLGLTRAQALAEARRPLWDAPAHWGL